MNNQSFLDYYSRFGCTEVKGFHIHQYLNNKNTGTRPQQNKIFNYHRLLIAV